MSTDTPSVLYPECASGGGGVVVTCTPETVCAAIAATEDVNMLSMFWALWGAVSASAAATDDECRAAWSAVLCTDVVVRWLIKVGTTHVEDKGVVLHTVRLLQAGSTVLFKLGTDAEADTDSKDAAWTATCAPLFFEAMYFVVGALDIYKDHPDLVIPLLQTFTDIEMGMVEVGGRFGNIGHTISRPVHFEAKVESFLEMYTSESLEMAPGSAAVVVKCMESIRRLHTNRIYWRAETSTPKVVANAIKARMADLDVVRAGLAALAVVPIEDSDTRYFVIHDTVHLCLETYQLDEDVVVCGLRSLKDVIRPENCLTVVNNKQVAIKLMNLHGESPRVAIAGCEYLNRLLKGGGFRQYMYLLRADHASDIWSCVMKTLEAHTTHALVFANGVWVMRNLADAVPAEVFVSSFGLVARIMEAHPTSEMVVCAGMAMFLQPWVPPVDAVVVSAVWAQFPLVLELWKHHVNSMSACVVFLELVSRLAKGDDARGKMQTLGLKPVLEEVWRRFGTDVIVGKTVERLFVFMSVRDSFVEFTREVTTE